MTRSILLMIVMGLVLVVSVISDTRATPQGDGQRVLGASSRIVTFETGKQPTKEIHVATTGSDIEGCGSLENPCASVSFVADQAAYDRNPLLPGTAVRIHPGTYTTRQWIQKQKGTAEAPIWIGGIPGKPKPVFVNAKDAFHVTEIAYVVLHDIEVHRT
jgi:hypothetical protein